jgi:hypothetical protein
MADSAAGLERSTESTTYSPVPGGDRASTDRIPLTVLSADAHDPIQLEIESLVKLGARKQDLGQDAEADDCYRKALELGYRALRSDSPELVLLLTDLTRLYLKKSSFGAAEPLLLRLLDMKRRGRGPSGGRHRSRQSRHRATGARTS